MSCCYPAMTWVSMVYLGDKQLILVWCKVPMNTALLALETRVDAFLWFGSVYETVYLYEWYLQNVLVYGRTEWKILICLQAIKIHSDETPSYALMWSVGEDYDEFEGIRTSTCLSFESKLTMIFVFFYDFPMGYMSLMISQCYPVGFGYILYWMVHNDDDFCPSIFPMGFLGLYFSVQSKTVPWALVSRIGLRGVFDGTVDGLVA